MATERKRSKDAILGIIILSLISSIGLLYKNNGSLKKELDVEKLKQDSILATKLLLDKEIFTLHNDINFLAGKNSSLDSLVISANNELSGRKAVIERLKKDQAGLPRLKKELQSLKKLRQRLAEDIEKVIRENKDLKSRVALLEDLLKKEQEKSAAQGCSTYLDNVSIELHRKSPDKLAVKARKVKGIKIGFEIKPKEKLKEDETLYIVVKDKSGNVVQSQKTMVMINGEGITFTESIKILALENKKIQFNIELDDRLKNKGLYTISVYGEKQGLIGVTQFNTN